MEIPGVVEIPMSLLLGVAAIALLYIYFTWNFNTFKKMGVPGPKPWPIIGNHLGLGFGLKVDKWRAQYGDVFGVFLGREPAFVISDLKILKEVFVKSFQNFRNRRSQAMVSYPFNLSVFFLKDEAWRRVRNIMSPTFSGSKLRVMSGIINESARNLAKNFKSATKIEEGVSVKDYFGAFTMDVISSTAFGIKVDSQNDFNHPFVKNAKAIFTPIGRWPLLLTALFPFLRKTMRKLGLTFPNQNTVNFFVANIKEIVRQRQQDPDSKRVDFLQLLMDAEVTDEGASGDHVTNGKIANGHTPEVRTQRRLTTDEIVGQGSLFFVAGYETTASTLNYASFALATNPDVQEKAYKEINDVLGEEEPSYDNIGKLKYLEGIILETLRMYPPVLLLHRTIDEDIELEGIRLPKGRTVFIPVFAIQRSPELYPDPEKFMPERHENKHDVNPLSFLSFGFGPRICIGMRLALVETKIALIHVLRSVKFERLPNTPDKMEFRRKINLLSPVEANMLRVMSR